MRWVLAMMLGGCFSPPSAYVLDSSDPLDLEVAQAAVDEWNSQGGYELVVRAGAYGTQADDECAIIWGDMGNAGPRGYTTGDGRLITLTTNVHDPWYKGVGPCAGSDMQSILAHEIGHTLGKSHTDVPADTMYAGGSKWCEIKHVLTEEDINQ